MSTEITDFEYGDYDLEEDVTPVPAFEALPYPDVEKQDTVDDKVLGFTDIQGVTTKEAIATARAWSRERRYFGVGECLATVRLYFQVPAKYGTAALSWEHAAHKHYASSGKDVPRGAPVWWTGGSKGAGHIALSIGGGLCYSTDWKEAGRIDVARIDDITVHWGLEFKGWTREINDEVVWRPATPGPVVHLSNLLPSKRDDDVLEVKKRLRNKGYKGFMVSSNKYGKGIQSAYAKYQARLGYSGKDANGVPGKESLQKLGFRVVA